MKDMIDARIRAGEKEMVETLRRLVGVQTQNPPGHDYEAMTQLLVLELKRVGLLVKRLAPAKVLQRRVLGPGQEGFPRYNVLGRLARPGARRTLHFNAHYDVVPVGGRWKHEDPFSGAVEKGWIYGRGTADMKGSIASLLLALRALREAGQELPVNLEVSFTADEETDSELGAGWLVKHAKLEADYAIVMEGGEDDSIGCGHNGVVWLEVEVRGRAAHGSRPELGVNALEKMALLVLSLEEYKEQLSKRSFLAPDGSERHPTINLGGVFQQGPGGKINTVPALGRFSIDRRVLPNETTQQAEAELRAELERQAARIPGCRITVHKVSENHPCFSKPEDPFFAAMARSVAQVRRRDPSFGVSTGFNDMHFFRKHLGIPTLGYGPGGRNEHAVDERARIRDLVSCARIYARLILAFEENL